MKGPPVPDTEGMPSAPTKLENLLHDLGLCIADAILKQSRPFTHRVCAQSSRALRLLMAEVLQWRVRHAAMIYAGVKPYLWPDLDEAIKAVDAALTLTPKGA